MGSRRAASVIKLDLQRTDRRLLDQLIAFLDPLARSRRVMISLAILRALG